MTEEKDQYVHFRHGKVPRDAKYPANWLKPPRSPPRSPPRARRISASQHFESCFRFKRIMSTLVCVTLSIAALQMILSHHHHSQHHHALTTTTTSSSSSSSMFGSIIPFSSSSSSSFFATDLTGTTSGTSGTTSSLIPNSDSDNDGRGNGDGDEDHASSSQRDANSSATQRKVPLLDPSEHEDGGMGSGEEEEEEIVRLSKVPDSHLISSRMSPTADTLLNVKEKAVGITGPSFVCVSVDWWPESKCDYERCAWRGPVNILSLDFSLPILKNAVRALSGENSRHPVVLRVGGTLADYITYDMQHSNPITSEDNDNNNNNNTQINPACKAFEVSAVSRIGFQQDRGPCLTRSRWEEMFQFCKVARCRIIFTVSALQGRRKVPCWDPKTFCKSNTAPACCTEWTGTWNGKNLQKLLETSKHMGYRPLGLQFGNELAGPTGIGARLTPEKYMNDFRKFTQIVKAVWPSRGSRPLLMGPASKLDDRWLTEWLRMKPDVDVITHHIYSLGAGSDPSTETKMFNTEHLNKARKVGGRLMKVVKANTMHPGPQVWVGEGGGAFNSGRQNATGCFASSFWFLDEMATFAQRGHQVYCRQSLLGGHYALLAYTPPDSSSSFSSFFASFGRRKLQRSRSSSSARPATTTTAVTIPSSYSQDPTSSSSSSSSHRYLSFDDSITNSASSSASNSASSSTEQQLPSGTQPSGSATSQMEPSEQLRLQLASEDVLSNQNVTADAVTSAFSSDLALGVSATTASQTGRGDGAPDNNEPGTSAALVDSTYFTPTPDFYAALLWKRLMGSVVLNVTLDTEKPLKFIRAYAHCTPAEIGNAGDVTLLLLNLASEFPAVEVDVRLSQGANPGGASPRLVSKLSRSEFHMTAPGASKNSVGDIYSRNVWLNGKLWSPHNKRRWHMIPEPEGKQVDKSGGKGVILAPRSYAFVLVQDARHKACQEGYET